MRYIFLFILLLSTTIALNCSEYQNCNTCLDNNCYYFHSHCSDYQKFDETTSDCVCQDFRDQETCEKISHCRWEGCVVLKKCVDNSDIHCMKVIGFSSLILVLTCLCCCIPGILKCYLYRNDYSKI